MAEEKKGYDEFGNNVYDDDNLIEAIKTSKTKKVSVNHVFIQKWRRTSLYVYKRLCLSQRHANKVK